MGVPLISSCRSAPSRNKGSKLVNSITDMKFPFSWLTSSTSTSAGPCDFPVGLVPLEEGVIILDAMISISNVPQQDHHLASNDTTTTKQDARCYPSPPTKKTTTQPNP
jgi:hypothetical protein